MKWYENHHSLHVIIVMLTDWRINFIIPFGLSHCFAVCGSRFSTHPHPPKGHMPAPHRRILPKKPTSSKYHVPKITIDHIDEPESKQRNTK